MLPALLNTPKTLDDWHQWSFNNARDHQEIIQAIQETTGNITGVTLTNGGSGYTSIPGVTLDSHGSGASFNISIRGGVIKSVTVATQGQGYQSDTFVFTGGGGSGATATITVTPYASLPLYQLDPINFRSPMEFLRRHSQAHTDMNGALGLQSEDLSSVDIEDENKVQAWIYTNYLEHNQARERLGI